MKVRYITHIFMVCYLLSTCIWHVN